MIRRTFLLMALLAVGLSTYAQTAVPSPAAYLGYEPGERFTPHARIAAYFEQLASTSELVTLREIGETYEHRPLLLATITAPRHHANLERIRGNVARLASGEGDAASLAANTPAVVWLAFGVHGNESSSAEAAMLVAHALATDPQYASLLDDVVVVIDPVLNPDGRDRYVEWYRRTRGSKANPDPLSFEHMEPWPGGRYNHYMVDMNRDWSWLTQRETQARVAAYGEWNPQVFVDFHEMGHESTYFFPPSANPLNANLPGEIESWLERFGRANATAFSARGWPFFVGERFDLFYPGYGDSWPSLRGAVGMTYEMAGGGRAGSVVERRDGTALTLRDRIERHFTAAMVTVRTAAEHREGLLRYTHQTAQSQIRNGRNTFLLAPGTPGVERLVSLLMGQGIRVEMLSSAATLRATSLNRDETQSRTFPRGTAVVTTRQPLGRLATTLLERTPVFSGGFLEQQRVKADEDDSDDFYDLTTWSLPIA
ncbi:MAG: M14 family zinc carboxypeptidase, partial [Gemmatimonadaceae bacterium]